MPGRNQYPSGGDLGEFLTAAGVSDDTLALFDLELFAVAGWTAFNRQADRAMLAVSGTRSFDRAACNGVLVLGDDLASGVTPTVADLGTALTVGTQVRFEPLDAVGRGRPYNRARFAYLSRYGYPYTSPHSLAPPIAITGSWGYATLIPEDAFVGMLAMGALALLPQLAQAQSQGLVTWREADMSESYGDDPLKGLRLGWQGTAWMTCGGMTEQGKQVYGRYTRIPMS